MGPVRAACSHLDADFTDDASLFQAVRDAVATQYNNTGSKTCFDIGDAAHFMRGKPATVAGDRMSTQCTGSWDYQYCTEKDIYYCPNGQNCSDWDFEGIADGCQRNWGVRPRLDWTRIALSSKRLESSSNMVFSNGRLDPWHAGGVLHNVSSSVRAIIIENGAHHIDLMFSDPVDAGFPDIVAAREFEREAMREWVAQFNSAIQKRSIV